MTPAEFLSAWDDLNATIRLHLPSIEKKARELLRHLAWRKSRGQWREEQRLLWREIAEVVQLFKSKLAALRAICGGESPRVLQAEADLKALRSLSRRIGLGVGFASRHGNGGAA